VLLVGVDVNDGLKFHPRRAVEAHPFGVEIVEERKGGIGLDGVVSLDPRKILIPVIKLALGLFGIVEETAGLEVVVVDEIFDGLGLRVVE
jgi:hypothetical protein